MNLSRQPFFVTGLPRSGTAWLANLFTTNKSICYHEPVKPIEMLLARNPGRRVGVSDSSLVRRFDQVSREWPLARWLVVIRQPAEVVQSLLDNLDPFFVGHEDRVREEIGQDMERLVLLMKLPNVATLDYRFLQETEVMRQAWKWLLPEVKFDEERFEVLHGLNVQQDFKRALAQRPEAVPMGG